ncbi:MAG: CopG family transcriptional regulator [Desulfobacteraceae bacterium]|nr:MAG: CopG family transcriptional regulator [Desulfobacteraceae bacterium]
MVAVINVKVDPKLKQALDKFAQQQGISVSALIRQTMIKSLQEQGIDWREEEPKKKPRK